MKKLKVLSLFVMGALSFQLINAQGVQVDPFAPQPQIDGNQGKILKLKVEIYSVKKEDYVADRAKIHELVKAGKAKLVSGGETQFPSGQRSLIESTKEIKYAAAGDENGLEFETREVGTNIEVEGVVGADGYTVDLGYAISHVTAAPESEWRKTPVAGNGLAVEDPKFSTKKLTSNTSLWLSDQWKVLGIMPELTGETEQSQEVVYPVFIQLQKADGL